MKGHHIDCYSTTLSCTLIILLMKGGSVLAHLASLYKSTTENNGQCSTPYRIRRIPNTFLR
jgi:hypothetical protein